VASEPAPEITRGAERAAGGIFSFFAGDEPKVTPQQARDRAQAAGNVEMQHAQAHKAAQQEHDARLQRTLDEIRRAENDRQATPEYFRTRPINRDRDEGYEREREIER
jgi:hypothetical protein